MQPNLLPISEPDELREHFNEIIALADSEKNNLGFLPRDALCDGIVRKKVLALVDKSRNRNRLAGYLLFSGRFPNAKVQQIAVTSSYRRAGIGSALLRSLVDFLERRQFLILSAHVASDLRVPLEFYSKNGFEQVSERSGGKSRRRRILVYVRELESESLFAYAAKRESRIDLGIKRRSARETPFYSLDLNVYFDLARERDHSEDARKLFGAALDHRIRLTVANEFVRELMRTSRDRGNDPVLELAFRLPRLPSANPSELKSLSDDIHDFVFVQSGATEAGTEQARSDAAHLAHAALARASAFVTRDGTVLSAGNELVNRYGIDVLTVKELVALLPPDNALGNTSAQVGSDFISVKACPEDIRNYMSTLILSQETIAKFSGKDTGSVVYFRRLVQSGDNVFGCAVLLVPRSMEFHCEMFVHVRPEALNAELYVDHLLTTTLAEASKTSPVRIELERSSGQSTLIGFAKARGFVRQPSTHSYAKFAMGRPITAKTWDSATRELSHRTGLLLPKNIPVATQSAPIQIRTDEGETIRMSQGGLEDFLAPALFIWPGRSGVLVPIKREYSDRLLQTNRQLKLGLTSEMDAAFFSKRGYVNTPNSASIMQPNSPILFYESMGKRNKRNRGAGAVVAVGRIVDSVILDSRDLPPHAKRRIVVDDPTSVTSTKDVLYTTFDNLFSLPNPVKLSTLKQMTAVDQSNLVTARRVSDQIISQILDEGWESGLR